MKKPLFAMEEFSDGKTRETVAQNRLRVKGGIFLGRNPSRPRSFFLVVVEGVG